MYQWDLVASQDFRHVPQTVPSKEEWQGPYLPGPRGIRSDPKRIPSQGQFPPRGIEEHCYRKSTLDDLLGEFLDKVHTDPLYAGLDRLYAHKESIEKHPRHRAGELFEAEFEVLIYDLTSTSFEGKAEGNTKAARGYSRNTRFDCKQVCIGLVVTPDGFPVAHEVFEGNRSDSKTVSDMVESMEQKHGKIGRVWLIDRGMVSEENIAFLRERGGAVLYRGHAQSRAQAL